jgi:putative membrane protein
LRGTGWVSANESFAAETAGRGKSKVVSASRRRTTSVLLVLMKMKNFVVTLGIALVSTALCFGAEKEKSSGSEKSSTDATFIKKAANGGMTEVELGKIAGEKAKKDDVKSFAERMVKDHGKANDDLKSVASKMNVEVPDKVNAKHQAVIDRFSKMSGDSFDAAYVKAMVKDHKKTVADFESAQSEVKNEDLKKFITDTLPVLKEHYEMVQKLEGAK